MIRLASSISVSGGQHTTSRVITSPTRTLPGARSSAITRRSTSRSVKITITLPTAHTRPGRTPPHIASHHFAHPHVARRPLLRDPPPQHVTLCENTHHPPA